MATKIDSWKMRACTLLLACAGSVAPPAFAQSPTPATPFVVEYYYKVGWGHQDEFITLFKKNHYPVLRRLKQLGYIRDIGVAYPVNHAGEADRWDMRVTVTFRDANASLPDPAVDKAIIAELYPDKANLRARGKAALRTADRAHRRPGVPGRHRGVGRTCTGRLNGNSGQRRIFEASPGTCTPTCLLGQRSFDRLAVAPKIAGLASSG